MISRLLSRLRRRDGDYLPARWLKDRERLESRIEFHGPKWNWPVNRWTDRASDWNRYALRKRDAA